MWGLGCLVWETYNGVLTNISELQVTLEVSCLLIFHIYIHVFFNFNVIVN